MVLMILAGLWALILGRLTITESLSLDGKRARLYGATLIAFALLVMSWLGPLIGRQLPASLRENDVASIVVNAVVAAAIIVALTIPFRDRRGVRVH
jgi:uncharacterized membrane protein